MDCVVPESKRSRSNRVANAVQLRVLALTARRERVNDTYNDVLRKLLRLGGRTSQSKSEKAARPAGGKPWVVKDVEFPSGSRFRMKYKGTVYEARVVDGKLRDEQGRQFHSPSQAAIAISETNVNGWRLWECQLPGSAVWERIDDMRKRRTY